MTRKDQIKILDDKIESNTNQYKVDRLNAEISAFSSGDLNEYEFLTRKDLKYKPNALDKVKFEFSPLGKTFSMGLKKTAEGYQVEDAIKLLKDIRDGLAGGVNRLNNRQDNNDDDNNDDYYSDDSFDTSYTQYSTPYTSDNNDDDDNGSNRFDDRNDKIYDILNKFKNDMEVSTGNLYKKVTDKEHNLRTRLDKLNNNFKKLDNYIKENNDKKIDTEKKLDTANNEYNHLLLEYNQSRKELMESKDKLNETKDKLDKAKDDINKKTKYIDELEKIQDELNYQNAKVIKLESKLNKKNKDINMLKKY